MKISERRSSQTERYSGTMPDIFRRKTKKQTNEQKT